MLHGNYPTSIQSLGETPVQNTVSQVKPLDRTFPDPNLPTKRVQIETNATFSPHSLNAPSSTPPISEHPLPFTNISPQGYASLNAKDDFLTSLEKNLTNELEDHDCSVSSLQYDPASASTPPLDSPSAVLKEDHELNFESNHSDTDSDTLSDGVTTSHHLLPILFPILSMEPSSDLDGSSTHSAPSIRACSSALTMADALTSLPMNQVIGMEDTSTTAHLFQVALHLPRLVRTAALGTLAVARAVVEHVFYGPPHDSWSLLTTATRSALRAAMLANAPAHGESALQFVRRATAFTFPTSPHRMRYTCVQWLTGEIHAQEAEFRTRWRKTQVITDPGQKEGHPINGEFVLPISRSSDDLDQLKTLIIYVHGGAFHFLSARTHRCITAKFARSIPNSTILALNQRLGPEHTHAASVEDVILAYLIVTGYHQPRETYAFTEHPLANLNVSATPPNHRTFLRSNQLKHQGAKIVNQTWPTDRIVLAGDSSGGNTVASALLVMKLSGIPLPGAVILFSPWLDPPSTSASWLDNGPTCFLPANLPGVHESFLKFCQPFPCTHPLVSPMYATSDMLQDLPPILIQVGDGEVLRDEGIEWGQCLARVGGRVRVEVYDGVFHAFHAFHVLHEARKRAFRAVKTWISLHLDHSEWEAGDLSRGMSSTTAAQDVVVRVTCRTGK